MARKFDKSSAFKSIVGADQPESQEPVKETPPVMPPIIEIEPPVVQEEVADASVFQIKRPTKKNTRNHHLHILVTPTMAKQLDQKCKKLGISRNEVINQLIEEFLKHD